MTDLDIKSFSQLCSLEQRKYPSERDMGRSIPDAAVHIAPADIVLPHIWKLLDPLRRTAEQETWQAPRKHL